MKGQRGGQYQESLTGFICVGLYAGGVVRVSVVGVGLPFSSTS